jgi:hypothetical protein
VSNDDNGWGVEIGRMIGNRCPAERMSDYAVALLKIAAACGKHEYRHKNQSNRRV